jgi:death-on-curing protein
MSEPIWIDRQVIIAIHEELLNRFGGLAGIRDEGLLDSALARPQQLHHYGTPNAFAMAASYAHGLVKNHPFLDGNKRIGFMAAYTFLGINGYSLEASEESAVEFTLALAAGAIGEDEYAAWLQKWSVKDE